MAFVQAMNTPDTLKKGVNGADVYTEEGVGDYRVSLFTMLNRGLELSYIKQYIDKIYDRKINDEMRDMFVMAFQTRDVRGGKGERRLFQNFMSALYEHDKETCHKALNLIPEYGCWRDMLELTRVIPELEADIFEVTIKTFKEDLIKYHSGQQTKMTLLAKWLPRENSGTYPGMAKRLANIIYSFEDSERKRIVKYRKDTSMMNKALKTVEINMCGNHWTDIKPETVPGRCLKIHNKAFLNEPLKLHTGTLRFPESDDRMECRKHFQEFIESLAKGEKKAHGANVVMPHELVIKALTCYASNDELGINQGQWDSVKEETLKLGGLGKCVPMCDFSGSMNGLPKLISLALGILVSEINHSAFKDHILTFDAEPKWHSFSNKSTLKEKLDSINSSLGQGLNTDFYKACMRILEKMKQYKVPVGEEPEDLIVFTDMGFDAASKENHYYSRSSSQNSTWSTQIQQIRDEFMRSGEKVWGEGNGWKAPRIVIWNLSAQCKDFHAKADQEGVVQLSGWSPSILKTLQKSGIQVMTPYMGMRAILDDSRYDEVRAVWNASHHVE